ncbi:EIS1 [Candida pseudojiufengensis]|uniref:EIS1 n=1 Tax=Candida pseudojiufengensis TaxID=497109 RepID=UPI002224272B|nr:EIS1 [Candida pseudojiufengensis]KAI5959585.1 EIS1 [Candida pseudojiufengensis]
MSHSSVYQTSGKPLSKEALYHQRLKSGYFQSPSGTIVGVNSNASDTAALLAASSDLSVKPSYERSIAPEAQTAALAAKKQELKDVERIEQQQRAQSLSSNYTANGTPYTTVRIGLPSALDQGSIYKAAQEKSSNTMTSRIDPIRDIKRSGIQSKQGSSPLNIDKINKLATKNSSKSLNSRFNPDLDYRSGLKKQKPTEFLDQEEEDLAASGAAASLKHTPSIPDYATQTRTSTFKAHEVVNSQLLAAAAAKANDRLKTLNSNTPQSLKQQAQLYANALALAQKNSDERAKNRTAGVINLGGGLTITQAELNKLASTYVQPVIDDIEHKADTKRQFDQSRKQRKLELKAAHEKAKQEEYAAKLKEKQDIEKAKEERIKENEELKKSEDAKLVAHEKVENSKVDAQQKEFEELEKKHASEKEVLLKEKKDNQDKIDEEETGLKNERKEELKKLQEEKDEILKPVLAELTEENSKLKEVTDARDELAKEVKSAEDQKAEYDSKVEKLQKELEETKSSIDKYETDLETAINKHETTDKELSDLKIRHDEIKTKSDETHKELDSEIAKLEKEKKDKTEEKAIKKKEIITGLDQKVKDEHKINDELPPHLKREINDSKLKDTSSLFSVEEPKPKTTTTTSTTATKEKPTTTSAPKANGDSNIKSVPLISSAEKEAKPKTSDTKKETVPKTGTTTKDSKIATPTPQKKEVTKPSTAATKADASGTKRPVTPTAQTSPSKKDKKSFSKRFSDFFKDQSKNPTPKSPRQTTGAKTTGAAATKTTAKPTTTTTTTPKKLDESKKTTTTTPTTKPKVAEKEEVKKPTTTTEAKPKTTTTESKPKTTTAATKAPATTSSKQPAAKDAEKEAKNNSSTTNHSEDGEYGDFDDELSLNKKNQGGVFKEEIL